jgi:hypothetical protein
MIAWIIGIVILLVISLFMTDQTVEPFEYNPPTVVPSKVRADLTCSDRNQSAIYDRFDNAGMNTLLKEANLLAINGLTKCTPNDGMGFRVFQDTGIPSVVTGVNLSNVFCCKGEMIQPAGTFGENNKVCLPLCPSNYTKSSQDETICIRNDSTCVYTEELSANIQNNWFKTCAALYKENTNLISTIQSISTVVSTFSIQSSTVQSNYRLLNSNLSNYTTNDDKKARYLNNFYTITNDYNSVFNDQIDISSKYNTLQADKLKFDTLFNNLGCSNYF